MKIRKVILTATTRCIYSTGDTLNFIFCWNWISKCVIIYHNEYNIDIWVGAGRFLYFANDATWICKILNLYYIRIFMEVHVLFKCLCWNEIKYIYILHVPSLLALWLERFKASWMINILKWYMNRRINVFFWSPVVRLSVITSASINLFTFFTFSLEEWTKFN